MTYAEGINEFIDRCNKVMPPNFYTLPIDQQRDMYLGLTKEFTYDMPPGVLVTNDTVFHEGRKLPIRVYRPKQTKGRGLLIYIRGGGFVVGSLETHNTVVAELCEKSGLVTIAPDFRMSPENPFPAALEDCYGVLCGVVNDAQRLDIDPNRIVISGDSSGANMAVAISMMSRDRGGPKLRGQALISPVLDFTRWRQGGADAPLLTGGEMEYYTACYAPEPEQVKHAYVSPLIGGNFDDLPPAYIMGAEMDSLLIDSKEYTRLLREQGIQVKLVVEPGLVHSAVRARGLSSQVADAWERFCCHAALFAGEGGVNYDN
ncbi:MAG: alpha/beta hydrolase [Calothrix sp. MO_167.B12]|nr:alpha/beta hydrolase [Calothrix sp. MO_167.B12]